MKEPILTRVNPTDFPIVSLALASKTMSVGQLTLLADPGITRRLRAIPGVGEVKIAGANTREMTVDVHPDALMAAHVSIGEVVGALAAQNLAAPVGRLIGMHDERTIRLGGRVESRGGVRADRRRQSRRPRRAPRRRRHRARRRPRNRAPRRCFQRQGSRRHRRQEVQGLQHDAGRRIGPRRDRGDPRRRCRRASTLSVVRDSGRARRQLGRQRRRARSSKARCSRC